VKNIFLITENFKKIMNKFIKTFVLLLVVFTANAQSPKLEFRLSPNKTSVAADEQFKVSVPVKNFINCIGFQYSIDWKTTDYEFIDATFPALLVPNTEAKDFYNEIKKGTLLLLWLHPDAKGLDLADNTVAIEFNFKAKKAGLVKDICFSQDAFGIEIWRDTPALDPISADFIGVGCGFFWLKNAKGEKSIAPLSLTINTNELGANDISVFPNPANDFLQIAGETSIKNIQIVDNIGRVVYSQNIDNQGEKSLKIDLSAIQNGVYFCKILKVDNTAQVAKFVKM
jgi:Secretion system C-terminal sorting domain